MGVFCDGILFFPLQEKTKGRFGQFWLVWKFEGSNTLADVLVAKDFPYNVSSNPPESCTRCLVCSRRLPSVVFNQAVRNVSIIGNGVLRFYRPTRKGRRASTSVMPLQLSDHSSGTPPVGPWRRDLKRSDLSHGILQLEASLFGGPLPLRRGPERENKIIQAVMKQILSALKQLHRIGIVHRDIKPQNIVYCKGRAAAAPQVHVNQVSTFLSCSMDT